MNVKFNTPMTIPGNVPGTSQTILGPAPNEAARVSAEENKRMFDEGSFWDQAMHFGVCSACMLPVPRCVCNDDF